MGYDVEGSLAPAFFICMVVVILLSILIGRPGPGRGQWWSQKELPNRRLSSKRNERAELHPSLLAFSLHRTERNYPLSPSLQQA